MKYKKEVFDSEVRFYNNILSKLKGKRIFLVMPRFNKQGFFALAPFSKAAHELGKEMVAYIPNGLSKSVEVIHDVWACYEDMNNGENNPATKALREYIRIVKKKVPAFETLFKRPSIFVFVTPNGFKIGEELVPYQCSWYKPYKYALLAKTCRLVWKKVFAIKPNEVVGCGFELIPDKKQLSLPLEDYLDNFAIAYAMFLTCPGKPTLSTSTTKPSQLSNPDLASDLLATLLGCELDKNIEEPVFKAFKSLSKRLKLDRLRVADALFRLSGKGYYGRHFFGERIGYPTQNRKSRWQSGSQMALKLDFYPQSLDEDRDPLTRIGFTETLPIDVFILSNNIDWDRMRDVNNRLQKKIAAADYLEVKGIPVKGGITSLKVITKGRRPLPSGGDSVTKVDMQVFRETGKKFGRMSNIPAGEVFITPEKMKGTFVGDVVISLDQSYMLKESDPIVVEVNGNYKVLSCEKRILEQLNKKKQEAMKLLLEQEKNKSAPQKLIDLKKRNFNNIGEFAINTNPKAQLSDYLIVNEKIAGMIHIALGSGFEPDRASVYHTDIVINAKRQKLNIWAVSKKKKVLLMKEGALLA
jgi:hypothetical protein